MISQQINLYHPIFRREQKLFSAMTMLRAWAALLVVALLVTGFDAWQTQDLRAAEYSAVHNEQAAQARLNDAYRVFGVSRARALLAALKQREQRLKHLSQFLRESRRAQVGPAPVFLAVGASTLPGLWVTHFALDRKRRALVLAGHSLRPALVPLFLHRVVSRPTLSGYRFQSLAITRPTLHKRYRPYVNFEATTISSLTTVAKKRAVLRPKGAAGGH